MRIFEKKPELPVGLFVAASLGVLAVFLFFAFAFAMSGLQGDQALFPATEANQEQNRQLFLKEDTAPKDPYITKVPDLYDMLRGPILSDLDPSLGNADSDVSLVIFSDFECAACQKQEKTIRELAERYGLRLIWKDFPYSDHASRSFQAALAARCAQDENAFWDFHDLLYSGVYGLDRRSFLQIAEKLSLDTDDFADCFDSGAKAKVIEDNMREAAALDIPGVPFIYINDQEVMGEMDKAGLEKIIQAEFGKQKK